MIHADLALWTYRLRSWKHIILLAGVGLDLLDPVSDGRMLAAVLARRVDDS